MLVGFCGDCPSDVGSIPTASTMFPKGNCLLARLAALLLYRLGASPGVCGAVLGVLPLPKTVDGFARRKPFSASKRPCCSLLLQELWTTTIRPQLEKTRKLLALLGIAFRVRKRESGEAMGIEPRMELFHRVVTPSELVGRKSQQTRLTPDRAEESGNTPPNRPWKGMALSCPAIISSLRN